MRSFASCGLLILLGLQGCAVGPNYQPPQAHLRNFHSDRKQEISAPAAAPTSLEAWWDGFNDPILSRLVERARNQNLSLAAALARVQQARAVARGAGAQLLPTADFSAQALRERQSLQSPVGQLAATVPGYKRDQSLYDTGIGASWELDLFGGLRRGRQAATAEMQAAIAAQTGTRISVTADTADAYLRIRGDQAQIAVVEQQVQTDQHLLDLVGQRFQRGLASVREVAQAEALLSQARANLQPLHIDLEAQMNRLDVLLGEQPGTAAAELDPPREIPAIPAVPTDNEPLDVLRRRPDVIAAERRLAAADARIGQALSDYYPKISISGLVGFESDLPGDLFKTATFQPQGLAGLRWRLFDFGKVGAEVAQARGGEAQALAEYRESMLHAAEDVENAFTILVQLEAHDRELQIEVAALQRARDSSQEAYVGGVIALTDVLDADRQLLAARDELAQTKSGAARAAVGVFRALGGGW